MKGRTAVVTGAAKGIGKAIALELARKGVNLVLNYRNSDVAIKEVIMEIENMGQKAIAVKADVSDFKQAELLIKSAIENFGSLDILVNNAGITKDGLLMRMTEEDFDKVIQTNLKGTFNCIRHASAIMLKQKKGKIVNISSVVGICGNVGQVNYAASKAGVIGITKSAAKELASRGVTVNAVAPGFINTDMTEILSDKIKESFINEIPLKRFGEAEDVAKAVCFLASDDADYITGQVLQVDGGLV